MIQCKLQEGHYPKFPHVSGTEGYPWGVHLGTTMRPGIDAQEVHVTVIWHDGEVVKNDGA